MFDWLSDNNALVFILVIVGMFFRMIQMRDPDIRPLFQLAVPGAFAWAALIAARNLGWPVHKQRIFPIAVFAGCWGLGLAPETKKG
jgi:hypothetical protein